MGWIKLRPTDNLGAGKSPLRPRPWVSLGFSPRGKKANRLPSCRARSYPTEHVSTEWSWQVHPNRALREHSGQPWSPPSLLLSQTPGLNHWTEPQEREGWECRTQKQKPAPNRKGETSCQRLCQLEDAGSRGNRHRGSRQGHLADVGRPWQDLPTLGFSSKQRDPSSQTILDGRSSRGPPGKGSQPACTARVQMLIQKRLKAQEE